MSWKTVPPLEMSISTRSLAPYPQPQCALCQVYLIQPQKLRCTHLFCYPCLRLYVESQGYWYSPEFPCPCCAKRSVPPWGIWHLRHSYHITRQAHDEKYQTWKYEAICDKCASEKLYATASEYCTDCHVNLCHTCVYVHRFLQGSDNSTHTLSHLSDRHNSSQIANRAVISRAVDVSTATRNNGKPW